MSKRGFGKLWYAAMLAALLALVLTAGAAAGTARVYVQRVSAAAQDDSITVEVMAAGVVDLYGAEVHLHYDPQVLAVQDADPQQEGLQVEPGTLLDPQKGFVVANKVDEQAGTVLYAITLVNPAEPVSGDGVLTRVSFRKLGAGRSTIAVEDAKLVAHSLQLLPLETAGLEVGNGSSSIAGAAAEMGGSKIWALGLIVLAGAVVSAGAWFLTRRRKPPVSSAGGGRTTVKSQPTSPSVGTAVPQPQRQPNGPTRGSPASLVRQGQAAMAAGDVSGAYKCFSEAVELDPYNLSAWMGKAQTTRSEKEREICLQRARELSSK
jgi:hypothetical protein